MGLLLRFSLSQSFFDYCIDVRIDALTSLLSYHLYLILTSFWNCDIDSVICFGIVFSLALVRCFPAHILDLQ